MKAPIAPKSPHKTPGVVPIGPKPESKELAWWSLTEEAKTLLFTERQSGRFGGTPGQAPYWLSQEAGNAAAAIEPLHYIENAMSIWDVDAQGIIDAYLRV